MLVQRHLSTLRVIEYLEDSHKTLDWWSAELKRRKVATLEARAPQVIAAGNIGCMMQIGSGTGVPVVHTVELLDWATGGPLPRALAEAGVLPQI